MSLSTQSTTLQQQAKEFRTSFGITNSKSRRQRSLQKNLLIEEFKEFLAEENHLYRNNPSIHAACLKELADLVYVAYQYAENLGWDLDMAMSRVHESNMSKLDENGLPIYREDGKVLKGDNYKEPTLTDLV